MQKIILDEIFGENNFLTQLAWEKVYSSRMDASGFSKDFDVVLAYAKCKETVVLRTIISEQNEKQFSYVEPETRKKARLRSLRKEGSNSLRSERPNTWYSIEAPDGTMIWPIKPDGKEGTWRWEEKNFLKEITKSPSKILIQQNDAGKWEVWVKQYFKGTVDQPISTILNNEEFGHTHAAAEEIKRIFGEKVFNTPKPVKLLSGIIDFVITDDSIILDSFAGSGTTAHAVLDANEKDGGNRRFILIECEEYADNLTAERVRRAINGYPFVGNQREELFSAKINWTDFAKKQQKILREIEHIEATNGAAFDTIKKEIKDGTLTVTGERKITETAPGLGGSFTYCTLGEPIEIENLLTGKGLPAFESLARYVFYTATGQSLETVAAPSPDGFIGETGLFRIHLFYQPDTAWLRSNEAALNAERVAAIATGNKSGKRSIIFAVAKFMSQKELTKERIEFCQLPYAVHRILGA